MPPSAIHRGTPARRCLGATVARGFADVHALSTRPGASAGTAPFLAEETAGADFLEAELAWFRSVLELRFKAHAGEPLAGDILECAPVTALGDRPGAYPDVLRELQPGPSERLLLALAYIPHIQPALLDPFLIQNQALGRRFTEFGGLLGQSHGGFLPTGETAMFLLAGDDLRALPLGRGAATSATSA